MKPRQPACRLWASSGANSCGNAWRFREMRKGRADTRVSTRPFSRRERPFFIRAVLGFGGSKRAADKERERSDVGMVYHVHCLREKLRLGKFVVTAEVEPPKGSDPTPTLEKASLLRHVVDALNVADCPMANLRMSPIALAHILQDDLGIEAIFHLTCRDRNVLGLQAELLGAAALGVRNILTLTGDAPERGDHPLATGVFDVDAVGLIRLASALNTGRDVNGNRLESPPEFFIGAAANPGAEDLAREVRRLEEKVAAGAAFVQTQPIYDVETAERFLDATQHLDVPILFGLMPLKSYKMACYLNENVPGITIREEVLRRVERGGREEGVAVARELFEALRGFAHGVHLFPLGDVTMVHEILGVPVPAPRRIVGINR